MNRRAYLGALVTGSVAGAGCIDGMPALPDVNSTPTESIESRADSVDYDTLYRHLPQYKGTAVYYHGGIAEVLDSPVHRQKFVLEIMRHKGNAVQIPTTGDPAFVGTWDGDLIYRKYDKVEFWGIVGGMSTYKSPLGDTHYPSLSVKKMRLW